MYLRALAIISGIALVAAAAYASLAHGEAGFTSPYGVITLAVAGGLIVGALCVGAAWSAGRTSIALAIAIGMLCGELYALILTGERTAPDAISTDTPAVVQPPKQRLIASPRDGLADVAKFAVEVIRPDPDGVAPARDIRAAYMRWCRDRGHDALPARDMADHLLALCHKVGLQVDANDGSPIIRGIKLAS